MTEKTYEFTYVPKWERHINVKSESDVVRMILTQWVRYFEGTIYMIKGQLKNGDVRLKYWVYKIQWKPSIPFRLNDISVMSYWTSHMWTEARLCQALATHRSHDTVEKKTHQRDKKTRQIGSDPPHSTPPNWIQIPLTTFSFPMTWYRVIGFSDDAMALSSFDGCVLQWEPLRNGIIMVDLTCNVHVITPWRRLI